MSESSSPVAPACSPMLSVARLSYRYPSGQQALHEVSFSLSEGERVALLGPNGAGKTTLMLHLNGLLPGQNVPGETAVTVNGMPVIRKNLPEIRRRVGLLFQDPDDQLFCPTVGEDVAFGPLNLGLPKAEVLVRVNASLTSVGLGGFETRSTQQLSFGERKRVCLAGVLACEPSVLILDEPSSNLDPRARRRFIEILQACPATQLVASHDLEMILELCTRALLLDHGRIQADGPVHEILKDARLMERHGLEVPLSLQYEARQKEIRQDEQDGSE